MANLRGNQIPAILIHTPEETSNSGTTMQTQQAPIEQPRVTDEHEVVAVDANVDHNSPEVAEWFTEETPDGISQDNEEESTRDNQMEVADRVTDVNESSLSSGPSLNTNTGARQTEPFADILDWIDTNVNQSSVFSGPSMSTNTGARQTEPARDNRLEVADRVTDVNQSSVSSGPSLSTNTEARQTEPFADVLDWIDDALYRRTRGLTPSLWLHGHLAGRRATMNAYAEGGRITGDIDFDLLPEPLFSRSAPTFHRNTRRNSVSANVDEMHRETFRAGRATLETVPEINNDPVDMLAVATPNRSIHPLAVTATTLRRPRTTSIPVAGTASDSTLAGPSMSTSRRFSFASSTYDRARPNHSPPVLSNTTPAYEARPGSPRTAEASSSRGSPRSTTVTRDLRNPALAYRRRAIIIRSINDGTTPGDEGPTFSTADHWSTAWLARGAGRFVALAAMRHDTALRMTPRRAMLIGGPPAGHNPNAQSTAGRTTEYRRSWLPDDARRPPLAPNPDHRLSTIPPPPRPHQHVRYPSQPLLTTNANLHPRPSRSSMMEYAKATEDVNDMRRFGNEGGEDEIVPGGLVRGSTVGGYPKRRSSVLRRVNAVRRERESALYSSSLDQAIEEENQERMTEMMEDLGTGAERSRSASVRKLFEKGKKRLSKLFD